MEYRDCEQFINSRAYRIFKNLPKFQNIVIVCFFSAKFFVVFNILGGKDGVVQYIGDENNFS